jgi:hypothetical protein
VKIGVYRRLMELDENGDFEQLIELLCQFITEWNLEDDDGPIPVSPEGFDRIPDVGFVRAILTGWDGAMQGVKTVSAPLGERSNDGDTSISSLPNKPRKAS